ncbi:MAG: chemotaxis protein CheW [Treponematales bacterium]
MTENRAEVREGAGGIAANSVHSGAGAEEARERTAPVDFKMVTFSLAGKDYGVDIMDIKEIARADKFTFVPNAASFVRGVYNLRGDIIPLIDMRDFFHLPAGRREDGVENVLILRVRGRVYGTIVDRIDKVVGIHSGSIQPPHPIFGDINIKYIRGVVEKDGALYIILDVAPIFSPGGGDKPAQAGRAEEAAVPGSGADSAFGLLRESLPALKGFYPGPVNEDWLRRRFAGWSAGRSGDGLQLRTAEEAGDFLAAFASPDSGRFWSGDYAARVKAALPDLPSRGVQVWNIGCGRGHETYSLACVLKERYPGCLVKIWANDSDIAAISQAPNMTFALDELPAYCRAYTGKRREGYGFNQEIRDAIVFEYHDILNENALPELDIIVARDLLSFVPARTQEKLCADFGERLKSRGVVFLGANETMPGGWKRAGGADGVSAFVRD